MDQKVKIEKKVRVNSETINVAFADSTDDILNALIAKGEKKDVAILQVIRQYIVDSKNALFEYYFLD